jgi:hypothetical protein
MARGTHQQQTHLFSPSLSLFPQPNANTHQPPAERHSAALQQCRTLSPTGPPWSGWSGRRRGVDPPGVGRLIRFMGWDGQRAKKKDGMEGKGGRTRTQKRRKGSWRD